jgi:hypothetical protein
VLRDVLWGLVTEQPARDVYGVVIDDAGKRVAVAATSAQRAKLRADRLGGQALRCDPCHRAEVARTPYRIGEYLQVSAAGASGAIQCTWCGENLCAADADWKEHAVTRKSAPSTAGPLRVDSGSFFLLEFFCPGCATALDVDIVHQDDPPLIDRIARWPQPKPAQ